MDKNIDKRMMEGIKLARLGFYSYLFDGTVLSFDRITFDFFELEGMFESPESVIGRKIEELFIYTGKKGRIRSELKANKSVSRMEYGLKTLKGKEKWGIHNSYLYTDEKTGQDAIQVCFYDITDVKKQEAERLHLESRLHQSEKIQAIGQLAGGIAHDFNNQLTGIIGFADLLKYELKDDYRLTHYVENILIAARHSADLTGKLLAFARKGKYLSVEVDIHHTIMEVISLLQHSIDKRITLQQIFKAYPPVTTGDPAQLQNAILNLALNSRDAMPKGGSLTFETRITDLDDGFCSRTTEKIIPGKYVEITVSDTGTGMTEETQKRMFEPFFTTKEVGKGTGMGLAAVYGTVKNHKGTIEVESGIGKGTSVRIFLPAAAPVRDAKEEKSDGSADLSGKLRFLIVDDEEIVCRLVKEMLEMKGHSVWVHTDSREAVELFRKNWENIDLVILDMVMPHMNGSDTFTALQEIDPGVRVLLSSGYSMTGEAQELMKKGAKGFIQKPFRVGELTKSIAEIFPYAQEF
ncbi:MAG: response regulator [Candidatus Delongbacteria bacterium]|nr:response regulator [Candidatus Delongbacteria bacterium]